MGCRRVWTRRGPLARVVGALLVAEAAVPSFAAAATDGDGEGLSDGYEGQVSLTDPNDSDGDGVDDGYETGAGMNPLSTDSDGVWLSDGQELNAYGTNPRNPDHDGDGFSDSCETLGFGSDPLTPTDFGDLIVAPAVETGGELRACSRLS